jgi:glycine hydroxymethyltransferase
LQDSCVKLAVEIQGSLEKGKNRLVDYRAAITSGRNEKINALRKEISEWASSFPLPVEGWRMNA